MQGGEVWRNTHLIAVTYRNWGEVELGGDGGSSFQTIDFCNVLIFTSIYYFCVKKNG